VQGRYTEIVEEAAHAALDLVPDRTNGLDTLTCRVVELPVEVALAGEDRAASPCGRYTYYRLKPQVLASLAGQFTELAASARTAAENKRACP
jgi:hypothetical protein